MASSCHSFVFDQLFGITSPTSRSYSHSDSRNINTIVGSQFQSPFIAEMYGTNLHRYSAGRNALELSPSGTEKRLTQAAVDLGCGRPLCCAEGKDFNGRLYRAFGRKIPVQTVSRYSGWPGDYPEIKFNQRKARVQFRDERAWTGPCHEPGEGIMIMGRGAQLQGMIIQLQRRNEINEQMIITLRRQNKDMAAKVSA
eukprot:jgi/Bigna1/72719/fgenesh1_pg.21_\